MYITEQLLLEGFTNSLMNVGSPWGEIKFSCEFFYQRGRTDLVAVSDNGSVIAFEAKLKKWRVALHQAYRNRCFADYSYVILPEPSAKRAYEHLDEFISRSVGICCVSTEGKINVLFEAPSTEPIQPWLRMQAFEYANGGENSNNGP